MDEVAKEPAHRASVSMPSLEATDDFPVPATSALNSDQTNCTFVSTDATFTSAVVTDALASSDALTSDSVSYSSVDTASIENTQSLEAPSVEDNTEALPPEGLDDSQGEEDPSIAIDQFIKKIADEQLSSKRIGVQEEKENDEEKDIREDEVLQPETKEAVESEDVGESVIESDKLNDIAEENAAMTVPESIESESSLALTQETNSLPVENEILPEENTTLNEIDENTIPVTSEDKSLEDDVKVTENKDVEPMEVDDSQSQTASEEINEKDTQETESQPDFMQAESIEEIQKEIDKIPPKKNSDPTQNGKIEDPLKIDKNDNENHTQKSIEQILCDDWEKTPTDEEKDIFGNDSSQDTSGVSRDRLLIDKAQDEIKKLDVLVCGECHNTFYYVEEFTAHKNGKCTQISTVTGLCENESKPQVWGYVLWKIKQAKELGLIVSSWTMYQKWCKLPEDDKNAWITAGQSIQFASKISSARITEVKGKQNKQVLVQKVVDNETLPIEFVDSNKENSDSLDGDSSPGNIIKKTINKPVKLNNDVTIMPSNKIGSPHRDQTNTAIRTTKILSTQKQEFVVEKIVAKRFNPRKKTWEYNIKWENFASDSNTWEPVSNLNHCKLMLAQFEDHLKRVKEEKAKQTQTDRPKGRGRPPNRSYNKSGTSQYVPIAPKVMSPKISNVLGGVDDFASGSGRPQRSSKQKALNQVKVWCGNISDDDSTGYKRKHDDDSDEDYDDKRVKLEEESDDSDKDVKPKLSLKKLGKTTSIAVKNGSTGAQQILPSNILIPDANGVVRINQKQLPSLSSGVYIMSKTAGIIKLDSSTSKVATSGGQTIVKVAPKIGQTQIKIVKKEGNTTKQIIQVSPKTIASSPIKVTPVKVTTQKNPTKLRKGSPLGDSSKLIKKFDVPKLSDEKSEEDSDDGLEPLPFPSLDDPLPEPESPPGEFVLDPMTGKIAGREYVDKPVVIKEQPQPIPPSTTELENIVKLAAADITEEDLQGDTQGEADPSAIDTRDLKSTIVQTIKAEPGTPGLGVRRVVKYTTAQGITEGSILNKALTQGQQRAIISPVKTSTPQQRTRVVQQKVINSMVSQRGLGQTKTVVRHVIAPQGSHGNMNIIRTRTVVPKPKFNLAPQKPLPSPLQPTRTYSSVGGVRQQIGGTVANKVQVYSTKSTGQIGGVTRKVGPTVVRTSSGQMGGVQRVQTQYVQRQPKIVQRVVTTSRKSDSGSILSSGGTVTAKIQTVSKPKAVINMPSLTDDDASISALAKRENPATSPGVTPLTTTIKQETLSQSKLGEPLENDGLNQTETAEGVDNVTDWSSFTMADSDNPIYITGDDGTIYQVAGQNEQGQTILITQGPDGQQQCLLVTNEVGETPTEEQQSTGEAAADPESVLGIPEDASLQAVGESAPTSIGAAIADEAAVTAPLQIKTDVSEIEGIEEGMQDQVVAQVVRAEPPSPGGTHKVVVMLPDGNLMVTQVSPEEYASLELE